ncbi:POL2 [Symbiodinium sp. CCMP2592]|nr:POL2 [Symbiodinium sp. CCMP2592]
MDFVRCGFLGIPGLTSPPRRQYPVRRQCGRSSRPWEVLGIPQGANKDEIKLAYRRLAVKFHPDVDKSKRATSRFQEIQVAYKKMIAACGPNPTVLREQEWKSAKRRQATRKAAASEGDRRAKPLDSFRISHVLDALLPSRETLAYGTILLILLPYMASFLYGVRWANGLAEPWAKDLGCNRHVVGQSFLGGPQPLAENCGDLAAKNEAKDMVLLNDSLQLAHKCILNSFYGYVMRKGARWHSMKMAGIVTYTGSNLIREAREFCEQVGLPLELDTDGIWCLLPKSFPDTFKIKMKGGKELKMPYPNCVLNYRVHQKYTNHQYQDWDPETNSWKTSSQNSILFEIDGPYKAMILPASTEEDKMLKKRYAVYNFDGTLAELKGFEVKRRGELRLIQVFQTEVFPEFLKGESKEEVWKIVGAMANRWLDVIESRGSTMTNDEVIHFFSENKTMSKSVEQAGSYKSVQATTVRRLAEFLGVPSMLQAEGISAHMLIANKPVNASCTERAIPVKIFFAEEEVKKTWLRHWLQDNSLTDFDMRSIIDWEYYKERLCAVFQKLISIPAAYQKISNPCPRVKVPEWLRKRVAEQNDQFKQRSLGMWFRPAASRCADDDHGFEGKRKIGDMEDLAGSKKLEDFPQLEYGEGPKKWLQVQKMRWAAGQAAQSGGARRYSLFDTGAEYTSLPQEALTSAWHVLAVEPSTSSSELKVGDSVLAEVAVDYLDDLDSHHPEERVEVYKGTILGFVGGMVRVMLDTGEEQILKRSSVQAVKDGGLFTVWVAVGDGMAVYRCEVLVKRQVILALEQDVVFDSSRQVRPVDLYKGLHVTSPHRGAGVVANVAPEIGLCSVRWEENGITEVVPSKDLFMTGSDATKVLRDAPRNLHHPCLVQMEMTETEFQQQESEGFHGDLPASVRVSSVYEAESPLLFDVICRLGPLVKFSPSPGVKDSQARGLRRIDAKDLLPQPASDYLPSLPASRNVYMYLTFDTNHSGRAFCGIFAPTLSEAWVCFSGTAIKDSNPKRQEIESFVTELISDVSLDGSSGFARTEVSFLNGKSLSNLVLWVEQRLKEIRKLDGGCIFVVSSQLSAAELRGLAPSCYVDQRALRHVETLRETPILHAPHTKGKFILDWPRTISKFFAKVLLSLAGWWRDRRTICRAAGIPICNGPETIAACAQSALDVMYSRQLQKDSQIRWASTGCRPDLGATSLALVDAQEEAVEAISWVLQGQDLSSGKGGGQVNRPGVYRTFCVEMDLGTKLCVCALLNARHLSDMEGGELSRKMIRKVGAGESFMRNMDHSSEASVTNLESLVTMVQELCKGRDTKAEQMAELRKSWAAQSETAREKLAEAKLQIQSACCNDEEFKSIMIEHHCDDARLSARLQDLRDEWQAFENLLDGLYGWLASPTSLLYDAALLRRVHQYMDRVLKILLDVVRRNGCTVIHASHSKVLLETGKLRVCDVQNFYTALLQSIQSSRALAELNLNNDASAVYYGVLWLDPSDWSGIPLSATGINWEVQSFWRFTEYLPPAVADGVQSFASNLLLEPQKRLGERLGLLDNDNSSEAPPDVPMDETELDAKDPTAMDDDDDEEQGECAQRRDVDMEPAEPSKEEQASSDKQTAQALEELTTWIKEVWFEEQRGTMLTYVAELQMKRQKDLQRDAEDLAGGLDSEEEDEPDLGNDSEDPHAATIRRQERLRRRIEQRWAFPDVPGRRAPPGAIDFEALRAIIQVYKLEDSILDQVEQLRDLMCQKLRVSSFQQGLDFEKPCFPLILRDVTCDRCCVARHLDVTSHPHRAPGLWVCENCNGVYNKDGMEARLVDLFHSTIQAWHSQEIKCSKCRRLRTCQMQDFCECFGRWQVNFKESDFRLIIQILRSLTGPHSLHWLRETLESHAITVLP